MYRIVFITIIIVFYMGCLNAQFSKFSFDRINQEDGLSQGTVTSITQDSRGFMWFGTYDGLNRYDGQKFRIFKNDVSDSLSISHNSITSLYEDRFNNLWIGTMAGGVNMYNREKENFIRFQHDPQDSTSLKSNIVQHIFEDRDGHLWLSTWGGGVNLYDREKSQFIHFLHDPEDPHSIPADQVNRIDQDKEGNLWLATSAGISKLDYKSKKFENYAHDPDNPNSISNNDVSTIFVGPQGYIWAGTWGSGLNRFDPQTRKFKRFLHDPDDPKSLGHNIIRHIYADNLGHLFAATWGGGLDLFRQDGMYFNHIRHEPTDPRSISGDFVYSIYLDKTGILWVGTDYMGINKYDHTRQKFTHFKKSPESKDGLNSNIVTSILEGDGGIIWIGTSSGLNRFNPLTGQFKNFISDPRIPNTLSNNVVKSMCKDGNYIWLATEIGLNRFNPQTGEFKRYLHDPKDPKSISHHNIWYLFIDSDNILWIGTFFGGLNKYNRREDNFIRYKHDPNDPNSIGSNFIWSIIEDKQGFLWIGTDENGLCRYDKTSNTFKTFKHDPHESNSLSDNKVLCLLESSEGVLWIGTTGGLNRFDRQKNQFISYFTNDGLPSNSIQAILEDENGNLWISTTNGLAKFNPKNETFQNFNESNGLQGNEFSVNACLRAKNGQMYFGGINGFNVFDPDDIKINTFVPPIVITDFQLFNKKVAIASSATPSVLGKSIVETNDITLAYDQNVFSFEFAALSFSHPQNNQYAYIMQNFETDWNFVGNRNFVIYTSLPPGSYTFRVKGSNNDGIWNEQGAQINLQITPPYWDTWWFRIIILAVIIYILIAYLRFRTRVFKHQNIRLENAVKKKTREMEELMDKMIRQEKLAAIGKISSSIAHELRNPLGAVKQSAYYLKMILKEAPAKVEKHLNLIEDELNVADRVIDDLMEMTRTKLVNKENISIAEIVNDSIERINIRENIRITLDIAPDATHLWADVIQMRQVLINIITNAYQAIDKKGEIIITSALAADSKNVYLNISDNGPGIHADLLEKVFEPLYTTKAKGTGLGLNICRQIIEKHDGEIKIFSEDGKGTKVSIKLPLSNDEIN